MRTSLHTKSFYLFHSFPFHLFILFLALTIPSSLFAVPAPAQHVFVISIDGGGSSYVQNLIDSNLLPNFKRFQTEGAWTNNARTDYDVTVTLPNHVTEMTGRGIYGVSGNGHAWTSNSDPSPSQTIHSNKGSYVPSIFDVAHDHGLQTAVYATKTKFSLFDTSYNTVNGAPDTTGPDNGRDKLDFYQYFASSASLTTQFITNMTASPANFALLHFTEGDTYGHSNGWGSTAYNNALIAIDGYLGQLFNFVTANPSLLDTTNIILTADHGGSGTNHSTASNPLNYTVPFYVWGKNAAPGADLYALNPDERLDPLGTRPPYTDLLQPIRNGDAANLALDLLGLPPIPGSAINSDHSLTVPEPSTLTLLLCAILPTLRKKQTRPFNAIKTRFQTRGIISRFLAGYRLSP